MGAHPAPFYSFSCWVVNTIHDGLRGGGGGTAVPLTRPWKKGRRSGTILVDLEAHRVLALLPNCEVETVAAWFRQHPSVLIVTRDRSQTTALAVRLGAPQALQIADRFHLHRNATECLEAILTREQATLRQVVDTLRAQARAALPAPQPHVPFHQRLSQQRRTRRPLWYEH
jgi:transposase